MAKVKITGHQSGSGVLTITAPNTSTDRTITLPDATATIATTTDVAARLPSITDGGNATAITIDSSENVGIGVVPESWDSQYTALQVGAGASITGSTDGDNLIVSANMYETGGVQKYINSSKLASQHQQNNGIHTFSVAPSGTADAAITWTNAMTIDNSGAVTMPLQPAFQVASNTMQNNITVGGSPVTVVYDTEVFDQNSDFTSNTFTAPVTGKYQLSATTRLGDLDSASNYYMMRIVTSNREYKSIFDPDFGQDNIYWSVVITVLADMDAGDTATVKFLHNNGDAQTDIEGSVQYTYFSGYLAC